MQSANCVSLLLLLAVLLLATLGPFAAAAPRSELTMAAPGDKLVARMETTVAEKGSEESAMRRSILAERLRTRKLPSDGRNRLDGRVAFTADYHAVQRHPSKHN